MARQCNTAQCFWKPLVSRRPAEARPAQPRYPEAATLSGVVSVKRRNMMLWLALLTALGAALRIATAYHGGISADESFLFLVISSPSLSGMIDFLRLHESHPPLFYIVMRAWRIATGGNDQIMLVLPLAIGISLIPAIYMIGRSVVSARAGMIAAGLVAISPPMIEYSGQLRPYGLLPLLTLLSCHALAISLHGGTWKRWMSYSVVTLLLLYTHHWAWLVLLSQIAAVLLIIPALPTRERRQVVARSMLALTVILIGYLPWLATLFFQADNAGHAPLIVENAGQFIVLVLYVISRAITMLFLGTAPGGMLSLAVTLAVAAMAAFTIAQHLRRRHSESGDYPLTARSISVRVFSTVVLASIALATLLSARSNLLLARCLAMLTPLALLVISHWADTQTITSRPIGFRARSALASFGVLIVAFILSDTSLLQTTRSNAKAVASRVERSVRPGDLLIVAPEWYAASFNHYFAPSIEQVDFPYGGRSGLIDFANVWSRVSDPAALSLVLDRIAEARSQGRRVWLISARQYLRELDEREEANLEAFRVPALMSVRRVGQIEHALRSTYGKPDTSHFVGGVRARYDELLPYLYSPPDIGGSSAPTH